MPPDKGDMNEPAIWLRFAKSDLALARVGRAPDVRLGVLCYLCQQAAEKALKAVLLSQQVEFPPTHNLQDLFNLLPPPLSAPPEIKKAAGLSGFAVKGRYPLEWVDVQPAEYEKAVKLAGVLLAWAEKAIQAKDGPEELGLHELPAEYKAGKVHAKGRLGRKGKAPRRSYKVRKRK